DLCFPYDSIKQDGVRNEKLALRGLVSYCVLPHLVQTEVPTRFTSLHLAKELYQIMHQASLQCDRKNTKKGDKLCLEGRGRPGHITDHATLNAEIYEGERARIKKSIVREEKQENNLVAVMMEMMTN
ncbi:hypothetical protein ACJX0J_027582, partial [Zea mays]